MKKILRNFSIPHVFIFLSLIILFSSVLTYIIPSGQYERVTRKIGKAERVMVVPGSYNEIPKHYSLKGLILGDKVDGMASPISILGLFTAVPKGMNQAASLIFFVFIIGAVFNLIQHTGTVNVIIYKLLNRFRKKPMILTLFLYTGFALGATFLGMGAEFIPLIPILIIISKEMGYDRLFGISILILPMSIGWSTAITNPFTVQIAQQIAEVPIGSGIMLRIVMFIVCTIIGFVYLNWYARRLKKDPAISLVKDHPYVIDEEIKLNDEPITKRHIWIGITAVTLFALILYAVQTMGWGLIEMTGGFFTVGLATILISGMSGSESMKAFTKGLEIMIVPALIVGFARGIQVVLFEGQIVDTILYTTSSYLKELPKLFAIEGMYAFQTLLNFFIPSASGQAMVSMPLMVPLADLLGISRQTTVLAFTSGDGFSNMIIPTSGILMAILGISQVPYEKWFRFILPLFLLLGLIAAIFLYYAMISEY